MEEFANMLRELREKAGLTQEALARKADLSTFTISKLEKGDTDPSWSTVRKLAHALGVSVAAFNDGTSTEETKLPAEKKSRPRKK